MHLLYKYFFGACVGGFMGLFSHETKQYDFLRRWNSLSVNWYVV